GGLLTSLEIAYQPVLNTTLNCSNLEFVDSEKVSVRENLFEQSSANITGLEPNHEYCIAIRVRTNGGESGFSSSIKLLCKKFCK
ncbi:MAG: fibronectin type III domain-containing protein, partial [Proteobacteria bacterium]|nr:fibronectin type III domain-containing protein [Pseudomonadota bacterium]